MNVKSVLQALGSLTIGMGVPVWRGGGNKTNEWDSQWWCRDNAIMSSKPSHTKWLSSCSTDGLLNDEWDQSGAARFCSHLDRCSHMWQLYSVFSCAAFIATSSLSCQCHPHASYLHMYFLMPLCGAICKLNALCGAIYWASCKLLRICGGFDTDDTGGISLAFREVFYMLSTVLLQRAKQGSALHYKPQSISGSLII